MEKETEQFQSLLFRLVKQLKADYERRLVKTGAGITTLQYGVLYYLGKDEGVEVTLNNLADQMIMKPPSLVSVIDSLEEKGYLKRTQDTQDRRKVKLSITPKGKTLIQKINLKGNESILSKALEKIGKSKTDAFVDLLEEIVKSL